MESPTQFDLEAAIGLWRSQLDAESGITPSNAVELEEHLRTSHADLRGRGLSDREAFQLAVQRLGEATVLAAEFRRVNPAELWRLRMLWLAAGCLVIQVWGGISGVLLRVASQLQVNATQMQYAATNAFRYANLLTVYVIPSLVFWGLLMAGAILLAKGRGARHLGRFSLLLGSRIRFVLGAGLIAGVIGSLDHWLTQKVGSHSYGYQSPGLYLISYSMGVAYKLPLILLIAWLMPRHFRPRCDSVPAS